MADQMRFVIHDNYVQSARDGQMHYIDQMTLVRLYGVEKLRWVRAPKQKEDFCGWADDPNDVHLYPRYDGNYSLQDAIARSRKEGAC